MSKIFISHSSANNAAALAVGQWLTDEGWEKGFFLDVSPSRGLAPGERWQEALKIAADRCEAVLFLISPAWRDSRWCLAEFLLAKQLGKTVFGVVIESTPLDTLPKEMTSEWQLNDLVAGADRRVFHVASDGVVAQTDVSFAEAGLAALRMGLQKAGLDPSTFPWPPPDDPTRQPYRGLLALDTKDAAVFFGREAAIVRGLDALRSIREGGVERMFVILGASGAGKSSFLRAGLWPRLRRDDRHFVTLPVIRPERAAITGPTGLSASLEAAFGERRQPRPRAVIRQALADPDGLDRLLRELQELASASFERDAVPPTLVIPVDQSEELYAADATEADEFLTLLERTLAPPLPVGPDAVAAGRRTIVVMAVRSDSYERFQRDARFELVRSRLFDLRPLGREEFKAVIEGPADRATVAGRRLTIDPLLSERLLQEAEGPDALPLLAFTLERLLVEYGAKGGLRLDDYLTLGGVRGSIEAAVTAAFTEPGRPPVISADLGERDRLLRESFIPWLAQVDPETKERKRRIAPWQKVPEAARPLLERMIEQRLLLRDRRALAGGETAVVVEVAHEALLRQWGKLTAWLDEEAEALMGAENVRRAADDWAKHARDPAWLVHNGARLATAEAVQRRHAFAELMGQEASAYLEACRGREEDARREREEQLQRLGEEQKRVAQEQARSARAQRRTKWALTLTGVVLAVLGTAVVRETRSVARQTSLVLANAASAASDVAMYDRALRFAVLAARQNVLQPAAAQAVVELERAAHASRLAALLSGHQDPVWSAAFRGDGRRVVTASGDRTARMWDAESGKELALLKGHEGSVYSAAFSGDGRRVGTASEDKTARVWDAESGKELALLKGHEDIVWSAAFSGDGRRVVTASEDKTARVWDAESGKEVALLKGHEDTVGSAAFSRDGQRVVTASWDRTARVWDAERGKEEALLKGHQGAVTSAAFSRDGQRVVTASWDTTARVWDAESGKEVALLKGHEGSVGSAAFSRDGRRMVTASEDKTARVWDAESGKEVALLKGHEGPVWSAAFSGDGRRVVTASEDKTARVWDAESGKEVALLKGHEDTVRSAWFSRDGRRVVAASDDKTARVWDAESGKELALLKGHEGSVGSAAFSRDGRRVVTASSDGTARVWDVHWASRESGAKLLEAVCRKKLTGAAKLTRDDIRAAVVLPDRYGESVCTPSSWFARE